MLVCLIEKCDYHELVDLVCFIDKYNYAETLFTCFSSPQITRQIQCKSEVSTENIKF